MSSHNEKPNDKTKSSETKERRRWSRLLTVAFFSIFISLFGFALTPSAANAWDVTLTNPGTGAGTVRWRINVQPWEPDQHLDAGQSVVIVVANNDYIYFDDTAPRGPDVRGGPRSTRV